MVDVEALKVLKTECYKCSTGLRTNFGWAVDGPVSKCPKC